MRAYFGISVYKIGGVEKYVYSPKFLFAYSCTNLPRLF